MTYQNSTDNSVGIFFCQRNTQAADAGTGIYDYQLFI
jgi:hypothetical protein